MSPHPEPHLPPHPVPLGCPRALALGALLHASNLHWGHVFFAFELELRHRFIQSAFLVLRPSVLDWKLYHWISWVWSPQHPNQLNQFFIISPCIDTSLEILVSLYVSVGFVCPAASYLFCFSGEPWLTHSHSHPCSHSHKQLHTSGLPPFWILHHNLKEQSSR